MKPTQFTKPTEGGQWIATLARDGYCIIPDLASEVVQSLAADLDPIFSETPFCKGGFYGERTKRFGRLLARSKNAAPIVMNSLVLDIARAFLEPWCDTIQLNLTQAIEIHPGALPQLPHRDQDMWAATKGEAEYLINVIWPLNDFTADNGATLIWPKSHGRRALDPEMPDDPPIVAECGPGSAIVFLGSTLHGAGGNRIRASRRGLIVSYSLGWLKPYENQWLAYPPEIARSFAPELAALVGYRQHRPNLGNFEGQCPSVLLGPTPPEPLGAVDTLRPDQERLVADYVAGQIVGRKSASEASRVP